MKNLSHRIGLIKMKGGRDNLRNKEAKKLQKL